MQTLNTLAQYENFAMSQDIFHLVFPAFDLFDRQLEKALKNNETEKSAIVTEKIEESVRSFLDSVSSVVYHTIHTDQMFLMVPGYAGTTFALPIKLCLLYLGFINKIMVILNDSNGKYEYKCLLSPEMESKPTTDLICLGLPHGDRLICVKLSQRSLYMPRNLFVILTHEIAHYVGGEIRCRNIRASYILRTIAMIIAKGIVSGVEEDNVKINNAYPLENLERRLHIYITKEANDRLKGAKGENADYYDSFVREKLELIFHTILADENMVLSNICNEVSSDFKERLIKNGGNYNEGLQTILKMERRFAGNRSNILASGVIRGMIHRLSYMYREVFSDVAAYEILQFDSATYKEAFCISDGRKTAQEAVETEQKVREYVVSYLTGEPMQEEGVPAADREFLCKKQEELPKMLFDNLFLFDCTLTLLTKYVDESRIKVKEFIDSGERESIVREIRDLFRLFSEEQKLSCEDIYREIQSGNSRYKKEVMRLREKS